jgi:hypothetical protein
MRNRCDVWLLATDTTAGAVSHRITDFTTRRFCTAAITVYEVEDRA